MYTQAMDTMGKDRDDAPEAGPLGRGGRAAGAASTSASTPATSSRPRTGCPSTTARRWCARSASTRTPRSSACCPRATGSRARRPEAQGDPARQGAGRGRPRPVPLRRGRDARHLARPAVRRAALGQGQVQLDLQLPDADLGRHGRDRLAGRRRGDHEPGAAVPLLVRAVRARDGAHLPRGELPPAPGLRGAADDDDARHRGAEGDGAGRGRTAGGGRA